MEGVVEGGDEKSSDQSKKRLGRKRLSSHKGKVPVATKKARCDQRKGKQRLGGCGYDPLNLEVWSDDNACSTCAPSPAGRDRQLGDQPIAPLPEQLHHDPLNLEGKVEDFQSLVSECHHVQSLIHVKRPCHNTQGGGKRKRKGRTKSHSESSSTENQTASPTFSPKAAIYRYGNYDQYYGYRNSGVSQDDPRLKLLKEEWFQGKDCLDIGCNTGQITITIAQQLSPRKITGIDIDTKLIRIAWKNLHRHFVPMATPSGQPFPMSLLMSRLPINFFKKEEKSGENRFPNNVEFIQGNYVPTTDEEVESTQPQYNAILCLSVTKWVHLNWGDVGLKRMFQKMYRHLHPGGHLILEPQPWTSYSKRKKLTPTIYENYKKIQFLPDHFHSYLMSPAVGFMQHCYLGISDNKSPGFCRSVHLYTKVRSLALTTPITQIPIHVVNTDQIHIDNQNQLEKKSKDPVTMTTNITK